MKTPIFQKDELLKDIKSPLVRLEENLLYDRKAGSAIKLLDEKGLRREMKLLCGVFRQLIKGDTERNPDVYQEIVKRWRELIPLVEEGTYTIKTKECLYYIDEMISHYLEMLVIKILEKEENKEFSSQLKSILFEEIDYRQQRGYIHYSKENGAKFLSHMGHLKKYITTVLFLNSKADKITKLIRQMALGMAAGLAMSWALFAQIYAMIKLGINLQPSANISLLVVFSFIGVFSYILKDRIKATTALWLSNKIAQKMHDHRKYYFMSEEKDPVARISEQMSFMDLDDGSEKLQEQWRAIENFKETVIVGGDVLHYGRMIEMKTKSAKKMFSRFEGIVDIHRFHVGQWVKTLADPKKEIKVFTKGGNIKTNLVKRIYEVDMVTRLRTEDSDEWQILRICLNRRGIVSVDPIKYSEPSEESSDDEENEW